MRGGGGRSASLVFALLAPLLGTGNTAKAFSQYKRTSPFLQKRFRTFAYFRISNRFDMHFARLFDSNKHLFLALSYGVSPKANIFEREHNAFFHSLFNRTKMITAPRQKKTCESFRVMSTIENNTKGYRYNHYFRTKECSNILLRKKRGIEALWPRH